MKIIIAGAGAVGTHLAKLLSDEKQDIILMDENEEKLSKLDSNFDLMTVNASPTSISGLKNAGVAGADLFIGVMPEESRNMTACMLATNMGAKKTVARIDNYEYLLPKHKEFFSQLGVHSLIYPEMLAAKDIVDAIKMSWWAWRAGNRLKNPRGGFWRRKSKQKTQNRKLNRRGGAVCGCREQETSGKTHDVGFGDRKASRKPRTGSKSNF